MDNEIRILSPETQIAEDVAKINQQVATSKQYPRSRSQIKEEVLQIATIDKKTAEECFYSLPRAGKTIEGKSIRLAEILISEWGNIIMDETFIGVDKTEGTLTVRVRCHDLEKNFAYSKEVTRSILNKRGEIYNHDMIMTTQRAAMSIARRDAIFTVIPQAYFNEIVKQIKAKATGADTGKSLAERIGPAFDYFIKQGVSEDRILATLEILERDEATEDHLAELTGLKTALKEKEAGITLETAFPPTKKEKSKDKSNKITDTVTGQLGLDK